MRESGERVVYGNKDDLIVERVESNLGGSPKAFDNEVEVDTPP